MESLDKLHESTRILAENICRQSHIKAFFNVKLKRNRKYVLPAKSPKVACDYEN